MTSSFANDTSKQSHSSLIRLLGKRKPTKPTSLAWEHLIRVEGCDPKYPWIACKYCRTTYAVIPRKMVQLI